MEKTAFFLVILAAGLLLSKPAWGENFAYPNPACFITTFMIAAAPHEIGTIDEDVGDPSDNVLRISPASVSNNFLTHVVLLSCIILQCQDCVFFMNGVETSMRRGENMTNPDNPCLVYRCLVRLIMEGTSRKCIPICNFSSYMQPILHYIQYP